MKVDSDEIWNNFVKTGKVQGFSIDAMLELKEVNFKSELNMSNQIVEAIEKGFALVFWKNNKHKLISVQLCLLMNKSSMNLMAKCYQLVLIYL